MKAVIAWVRLYPFRTWFAFALAVVLSLVAGIVMSGGGAPGRPDPAGATATPVPAGSAGPVTAEMAPDGLTLNHPGGASLTVPAGALPVGTVVAITRGTASRLDQLGELQPDGVSWDVAASVEPPSIPVTLVIPYDPGLVPSGARPLVTTFDELSGRWSPVKTSAVPQTGKLIAELPGFSLKTWIVDRAPAPERAAGDTVSWLEYQDQRLGGQRSDRPQCTERKAPPWVKQVVVDVAGPAGASACVRTDGEGFAVELAADRGYPVTLELDVPFVRAGTPAPDDGLDELMMRLSGGTGRRRVLLAPTGVSIVEYDPPPAPVGTVQGVLRHDIDTMVRWLVFEIVNDTPAARDRFGPAAVSCGLQALRFSTAGSSPGSPAPSSPVTGSPVTGSPVPAGQPVAALLTCLGASLDEQLRAAGFPVAEGLWRSVGMSRLPAGVRQLVGALRWVRGLQAGNFDRLAGELAGTGRPAGSAPVAVSVRWAGAPRWQRPDGVTPLFALPATVSAPGVAGQHLAGELAGRSYPESTGAWVSCAAPPATLSYRLDGRFRRLTAVVGLAGFAPADFAARFQVSADGQLAGTLAVDRQHTTTLNLDVQGVRTLVIGALRTAGRCPAADLPFGTLGDAYLFP